jgi:fucose 4-O-acetylase-like acetyltransferase/poly-gamma-glutamate capsule biosynthesis protein CapA/YwtB (metallophosphatase superfamily)/lysophospholipase L1-like esterase
MDNKDKDTDYLNIYSNDIKLNKKNKERYDILDNIKGLLIFTVVFSHFLFNYSSKNSNSLSHKFVNFIYCFHMPSFIFWSGFFSKSENSRNFKSITKLILIYAIFNYSHAFILYKYKKFNFNIFYPYNSYWYLLCLIYWRFSIQYFANQYFSITVSFIISILVGFWKEIDSVFSIKRAFSFYPYFLVGFKFPQQYLEKIIKIRKKIYFISPLLFLLLLYISLKYLIFIEVNHSMMNNDYKNIKEDIKIRIKLFISSYFIILLGILIIPNRNIYFLTKIGKNSLYSYLFHRIFTIIIDKELFSQNKHEFYIINYSIFFSIILLIIFGSDFFAKTLNKYINYINDNLLKMNIIGKKIGLIFSLLFIGILLIKANFDINDRNIDEFKSIENAELSIKLINNYDFINAIRISYVGDLIMLKDQIISAKNESTGKYEFDEMFKYTSKHFKESDLSIGVYEGPSAGNKTSYSTSNYGDGIPLYLNYPDEFAESVKRAGINLVTTANNHLLDKNINGAIRTIDILDKNKIMHIGSYKNNTRNNLLVINLKGINIAFLSYTSIVNNWNIEKLYEKHPYITNLIPFSNNKYYKQLLKIVEEDFKKAKEKNVDVIIVLVHMGTEFNKGTDNFQKKWNQIFSKLGANIILGDHAHVVEPLEILNNTFIVNCPGNFANSYIKNNGDATSIVDLYFDNITKSFIGSSIVPMYTQECKPKYFRALPIFTILNGSIKVSLKEKKRVKTILKMITKVMVGREINETKENYFFINGSYVDISNKETKIKGLIEKGKEKQLFKLIDNSYSITFIGDSITEGTKNNYHPWYEPLIYYFSNKKVINISKGGFTTNLIINNYKYHIIKSKSDLYIIAIGTNDIRYRNPEICAMTKEKYINNIKKIVNLAKTKNEKAKFVFISPWLSNSIDNNCLLKEKEKLKLFDEYAKSLNIFCKNNNYLYINPNHYINNIIKPNYFDYMLDQIHPNDKKGIELYSEAVLYNSP